MIGLYLTVARNGAGWGLTSRDRLHNARVSQDAAEREKKNQEQEKDELMIFPY